MLVTEQVGPIWLVTQQGDETPVDNVPAVLSQGQGGMLGVFLSPHYATDHSVYLTYSEPGDGGSSLALARARLTIGDGKASLEGLEVLWREMPKGRGGQFGAQIAFSPDSQFLFLAVGERQRMTPAQAAAFDGAVRGMVTSYTHASLELSIVARIVWGRPLSGALK